MKAAKASARLASRVRSGAGGCALVLVVGGSTVLAGWLLQAGPLVTLGSRFAMAPNTALAFLLAGCGLWLATRRAGRRRPGLGRACAAGVLLIALATGAEFIFGVDLHIDQLLAADPQRLIATAHPGRMAPATAGLLLLLGAALLALQRAWRAAQPLAAALFLGALVVSFGHAYGHEPLHAVQAFQGIALHTGVGAMLAAVGLLGAGLRRGAGRVLLDAGPAGSMARALLPWAVLVPPLCGWLQIEGQASGLYGSPFGTVLAVVATSALFVALLVVTAQAVGRADARRAAAQAQSERDAARYRSLFDGLPIGLISTAPDGRIFDANPACVQLAGLASLQELLGRNVNTLYADPRERHRFRELAAGAERVLGFETELRRGDGRLMAIRFNSRVVRDAGGAIDHFESSVEDVSGLRQAQRELQALNATLEQRVAQRTALLEAANHELEAFAYSISHDLRAPLRAIDGFSQLLLAEHAARLDDEGRDHLRQVRAAAQRMAELIDAMLRLARAARGELHLGPVNLSELADAAAAELRRQQPQREVALSVMPGVSAWGDARLLRAVLDNLFANAWKFTARQARACIQFSAERGEQEVTCHLHDNGAGFDMARAGDLFAPFQRLHAASDFPGHGIGLASVKRIVGRLGGRVWAEGAPGQGATFSFSLPAAAS